MRGAGRKGAARSPRCRGCAGQPRDRIGDAAYFFGRHGAGARARLGQGRLRNREPGTRSRHSRHDLRELRGAGGKVARARRRRALGFGESCHRTRTRGRDGGHRPGRAHRRGSGCGLRGRFGRSGGRCPRCSAQRVADVVAGRDRGAVDHTAARSHGGTCVRGALDGAGLGAARPRVAGAVLARSTVLSRRLEGDQGAHGQHGPAGRARHERSLRALGVRAARRQRRRRAPVFRSGGRAHHLHPARPMARSPRQAPDDRGDPGAERAAPRSGASAPRRP